MKTIKLELSVKILSGAIALGLFLNAFNNFPPKANANGHIQKVAICDVNDINLCAEINNTLGVKLNALSIHNIYD